MDAAGRMTKASSNERGSMLVFIALAMFMLLGVTALVVDMGYMYVTKGQLQIASDAAALAGIQKIKDSGNPFDQSQTAARLLAYTTARKNFAAAKPVTVANSGANGPMSANNDITVGFWNFSSHAYISPPPSGRPVNAIKVRARRTEDAPEGPVTSFLAKIMGWETINAVSDSIAAIPARAGMYIAVSEDVCRTECYFQPGVTGRDPNGNSSQWPAECQVSRNWNTDNKTALNEQFAWTSLLNQVSSTNVFETELLCVDVPFMEVCGKKIWQSNGGTNDTLRSLESVMYDPNLDGDNKIKDGSGNVIGWWVIVPVTTKGVSPGDQTLGSLPVTHYAKIRITSIRAAGSASGCRGDYHAPSTAPNSTIVIDRIMCVDCANKHYLTGTNATLVE